MRESVGGFTVLERIPKDIDAACPLALCGQHRISEALKITHVLERWIDDDDAAPFLRRYERTGGRPAVYRDGLAASVAFEITCKRRGRLWLELAGNQPILLAQERTREHWRSGISSEPSAWIEARDRVAIGRKQCCYELRGRSCEEPRNALAPFPAAGGVRLAKIIAGQLLHGYR